MNYAKFNELFDVDGLKKDLAENANGGFEKTPYGEYVVKIVDLALKESKKGDPLFFVWFEILEGDMTGKMIFMNQAITKAFQLHICNEMLRSLDSGLEVVFDDFEQYGNLIEQIKFSVDTAQLEYLLDYGEKKGYDTFKIKEVFEADNPL